MGLLGALSEYLSWLRRVLRDYPDVSSVARRMFVTNSFDSIMASIGVNVGSYSPHVAPITMAMGIVGAGLALGLISGMAGVYISERAERIKELRELERKVARSLRGTIHWRAVKVIPAYVSVWSGLGVLSFPLIIAVPYIAAAVGLMGMEVAFATSLAISLVSLVLIGAYLGKVSGESVTWSAVRSIALGVIAVIIVLVVKTAIRTVVIT